MKGYNFSQNGNIQYPDYGKICPATFHIDLSGCQAKFLQSRSVEHFFDRVCHLLGVQRRGDALLLYFDESPDFKGYKAVQILSKIFITGHFCQNKNSVSLDIYSYRDLDIYRIGAWSKKYFDANNLAIQDFTRLV